MSIDQVKQPNRRLTVVIIATAALVLGWLVNQFIIPGRSPRPYIGTCENTDISVTVGNPQLFSFNPDTFIRTNTFNMTSAAAINLTLIDSFSVDGNRIITRGIMGRPCDCMLYVINRSGGVNTNFRAYDLREGNLVINQSNGFWKIYIKP
ncbi:MAG: hypothetical protein R2794_01270 [Chitinophagales bacterium]